MRLIYLILYFVNEKRSKEHLVIQFSWHNFFFISVNYYFPGATDYSVLIWLIIKEYFIFSVHYIIYRLDLVLK